MNYTANDVKTLRERTGAGMMDCKNALVECNGDMEKAVDYLRERVLRKQRRKRAESQPKVSSTVTSTWAEE